MSKNTQVPKVSPPGGDLEGALSGEDLERARAYLLVINGKPEGPFSIAQLKEMAIKPSDFVRTADMDDYKEAHEVAELRELFGFKRQFVIPQYFAGFDQRLLASVLDWLIVSAGFIIVALIVVLSTSDRLVRAIAAISLLVIIPVAYLIYHIVMECSARQATFGKRILRIKVCDMNGERISAGIAIARNLAKIFSVITLLIGYLISFFNRRQQCLHDMMAGTLVIKDRLI